VGQLLRGVPFFALFVIDSLQAPHPLPQPRQLLGALKGQAPQVLLGPKKKVAAHFSQVRNRELARLRSRCLEVLAKTVPKGRAAAVGLGSALQDEKLLRGVPAPAFGKPVVHDRKYVHSAVQVQARSQQEAKTMNVAHVQSAVQRMPLFCRVQLKEVTQITALIPLAHEIVQ
jgi:hypothetical protein